MNKNKDYEFDVPKALSEGEKWLDSFETPTPSSQAIARLKSAVRRELDRDRLEQREGYATVSRPGHRYAASLAIAAMIIIGVGLTRLATQHLGIDTDASERMTVFVASLETVLDQDDAEIASIESQLAQYEAGWDWDSHSYDDDVSTGELFDRLLEAESPTRRG